MAKKFGNPGPKGFTGFVKTGPRRSTLPEDILKPRKVKTSVEELFPKKKFLGGLSRPAVFGAGIATGGLGIGGAAVGGGYLATRGRQDLEAKLDELIEFFDPSIFGRIPSLVGIGRGLKQAATGAAGAIQSGYRTAAPVVQRGLEAAGKGITAADAAVGQARQFAGNVAGRTAGILGQKAAAVGGEAVEKARQGYSAFRNVMDKAAAARKAKIPPQVPENLIASSAAGPAAPVAPVAPAAPAPVAPVAAAPVAAAAPGTAAAATTAAAPAGAAAKVAAKVRGRKMPPSVGTVGTHDPLPSDVPHPSKLVWGGETGDIQSGRAKAGVQGYLGQYNTGTQANAAQSFAQKAAMAKRGMTGQQVGGGQASTGVLGGAKDWWNKQKPGTKLAIGVGGGLAGGYAVNSMLSGDRNQQYIAWLDDVIELGNRPRVLRIAKKSGVKIFESAEETIHFDDPRNRNRLGEFQSPGEGGPDPNKMATVYKQPGLLSTALKGGSLALAGGALGQVGGEGGKQLLDQIKKRSKKAVKSIKK